jgi:hypothetical protein
LVSYDDCACWELNCKCGFNFVAPYVLTACKWACSRLHLIGRFNVYNCSEKVIHSTIMKSAACRMQNCAFKRRFES